MKKILIVEDETDLAMVLRKILVDEGYDVVIACDAMQGTEKAHREQPDLIILDLNMPAGGGLIILERIKMSAHTRFIPVIVLTGAEDAELKKKVIEQGVQHYIQKPYEVDELVGIVNGLLAKKK